MEDESTRSLWNSDTDLTMELPATVRDALKQINSNKRGVVFLTENGRLVGSFSDGDFRRAQLARDSVLDESVDGHMNTSPAFLRVTAGSEETFAALAEGEPRGRRVLPRVDQDGLIRGFASRQDWGVLPLAEPDLNGREMELVTSCIRDNWVSSSGPFVGQFEESFASFTGLSYPVAVSNGTAALVLALQVLGIGPGDEVIVPSLTFAATANAVLAVGAQPVFCEVSSADWCILAEKIEEVASPRVRAVIAVHLYGYACPIPEIRDWCTSRGAVLIEDCAEAIGTRMNGEHAGVHADAATFSFFGNKTITTGEGGMVFFTNKSAWSRARMLRNHGMSEHTKYWHEEAGLNHRLTNLQAAVGLGQMERAHDFVAAKRANGAAYTARLMDDERLTLLKPNDTGQSSFWLFPILLNSKESNGRDQVIRFMADRGIQVRSAFLPLHLMPPFRNFRRALDLSTTIQVGARGICLPNPHQLQPSQIDWICESLLAALPA